VDAEEEMPGAGDAVAADPIPPLGRLGMNGSGLGVPAAQADYRALVIGE